MLLTKAEAQHWAKYLNKDWKTFFDQDEFWDGLYDAYNGKDVGLPLLPNTVTKWKLIKRLQCPPGKCGKCCHYGYAGMSPYDIKRMTDHGIDVSKCLVEMEDGSVNLVSQNGECPFLKDNACSIYEYRSETCFTFPLQTHNKQQLSIRLLCRPALELARKVIVDTMGQGGKLLLPDLTIIPETMESITPKILQEVN
jgi:Fe-S-cluster containining protein